MKKVITKTTLIVLVLVSILFSCNKETSKKQVSDPKEMARLLLENEDFLTLMTQSSKMLEILSNENVFKDKKLTINVIKSNLDAVKSTDDYANFFKSVGILNYQVVANNLIYMQQLSLKIKESLKLSEVDYNVTNKAVQLAIADLKSKSSSIENSSNNTNNGVVSNDEELTYMATPCEDRCKKTHKGDTSDCQWAFNITLGLCLFTIEAPPAYVACLLGASAQGTLCTNTAERHYRECLEGCK